MSYRGLFDKASFYERACFDPASATIATSAIGTSALPAGMSFATFAAPALTSTTTLAAAGGGIGAAMAGAAPWLIAAGAGLSAFSALEQGSVAAKQARFQADIMQQQADRERLLGEQAEEDYRRNSSRLLASRRAILGGSGVEAGEGSPLLVTEDMGGEIELQARRIRSGSQMSATRLEQQAMLEGYRGRAERAGSYARAGGSLLSGAGTSFGYRPWAPPMAPARR